MKAFCLEGEPLKNLLKDTCEKYGQSATLSNAAGLGVADPH